MAVLRRVAGLVLIVTAILSAATPARAAMGDGVLGWFTVHAGGGGSYHESPYDACYKQFQEFDWDQQGFRGAYPHDVYWKFTCDWAGLGYPAWVDFTCATGYKREAPNRCIKSSEDSKAQQTESNQCSNVATDVNNPKAANPVEVFSGRKVERATDFETSDGLLSVKRVFTARKGKSEYIPFGTLRGAGAGWSFDFAPTLLPRYSFNSVPAVDLLFADGTEFEFLYNWSTHQFDPRGSATLDTATRNRFTVELVGGMPSNPSTVNSSSKNWIVTDLVEGVTYQIKTFKPAGDPLYRWGHPTNITYRSGYELDFVYNADGQVSTITDSFGRQLTFSWIDGHMLNWALVDVLVDKIVLPDGTALKYSYEATGSSPITPNPSWYDHMVKVEHLLDPSGSGPSNVIDETTYHYEDDRFPHFITGITDARGERWATWTYDGLGRVVTSSHGTGVDDYTFSYDRPSTTQWETTVTNPLGKDTVYTFNKSDKYWLVSSVDGLASTNCPASAVAYTYSGKLVDTLTDEEGNVTKFVRGSDGLPTSITQAYGTADARTVSYTWRSDRQIDESVAPGLTTDYSYDGNGRLTGITQTDTTSHSSPYTTNGQTRSWAFTYSTEGLLETIDGPLSGTGDTVTYAYDADGYLTSVTDELGHVTDITTVDDLGRPLTVEDANGIETALTYSDAGYLEEIVIDPTGADIVTTIGYDEIGQVTSITRADGSEFTYEYDEARRLVSVTDALDSVISYTHDDMGGITLTEIENASATLLYEQSATFDELGRLLTSVGASSQTWEFEYDKTSNLVTQTDPRSNDATFAYNSLNELIETVDQASNTVELARNDQGEIEDYTDPRSFVTSFVRNGWGEVIEETSPDIGTIVYVRDALGNITQKTDARSIVTNYTYDDAGRLTAVSYPASTGENVALTYDDTSGGNLGLGRLTGISDESGTTARTYNSLGLIETETVTALSLTKTTEYYYDEAGNLRSIVYPSGRIVSYWRDGEITTVSMQDTSSDPTVDIAYGIQWLPFDNRIKTMTFGNGLDVWNGFDQDYRWTGRGLYDGATAVIQKGFSYNDDLNLTGVWDALNSAEDQSYWYAANNMLQDADGPWGEDTYYQDGVGNLTWKIRDDGTVTSDQLDYSSTSNRLGAVHRNSTTIRTFTHDAAGNILTDTLSGVTTAYTYNHADRMASFTRGGTAIGAYTYNALGQMVVRSVTNSVPSGVTVYIYDQDGHVLAEYDGTSGDLLREYIWLGDRPLAVVDDGLGTPVTYYVHTDHLNRPIAMSDASKALVAKWVWEPYGGLFSYTGTEDIDLRFPGQLYQAESGLHYNWHRQYDPTTGRYTQPDPLGLIDGPSRYAYVTNDPLQLTDPTGQCPLCIAFAWGAATGAAVDIGSQLWDNGGKLGCVDWWSVGRSAVRGGFTLGAGSTLVKSAAIRLSTTAKNFLRDESGGSKPVNAGARYRGKTPDDKNMLKRGKQQFDPDNGSVWERDYSGHGGSKWKRWPSEKAWERGTGRESVRPDGTVR